MKRYQVWVWDQRLCTTHTRDDDELADRVDCGCCYERWVGEETTLTQAEAKLKAEAPKSSENCGHVTDEEKDGETVLTV